MDNQTVSDVQAAATAAALGALTRAQPTLSLKDGRTVIYWTSDQQLILQNWLRGTMEKGGGDAGFSVDFIPAIWPVILEKTFPVIAGLLVAGFLLGRYSK